MSRDLQDENFYISNAKKIPIKWTAPEVTQYYIVITNNIVICRPYTLNVILQLVMYGVMVLYCMRYGV